MGNGVMPTPYLCGAVPSVTIPDMAHPTQSQEVGGESAMDRMKKILSSPMTKKRAISSNRYFGIPLEDVIKREDSTVPFLVQKICIYIQTHGITSEGIFRVNGNSRVVDRLRTSFDRSGDADLEEAGDVMAVAGLLKLYLRELPDGVIPDNMTQLFVTTQLEYASNVAECVVRLRMLLTKLPRPSYDLLKFLSRFLVVVSLSESQNKMNPMALGIIFGPNLFRCSSGIEGLRQQGVTNQIVLQFITQYDAIFLEPGELSPYKATTIQVVELKKSRAPPQRPPPPRTDGTSSPPVPSPRKARSRLATLQDSDDVEGGSDESRTNTPRSVGNHTPRLSDDEFLDTYRSASPFVLDSDRSESSAIASSMASVNSEAVEKAISSAVSQHMFGDLSSEEDTTSGAPIPAPRKKRRERDTTTSTSTSDSFEVTGSVLQKVSIKERIQKFEVDDDDDEDEDTATLDDSKPRRSRPKSKAFELFESQGLVITPAPEALGQSLLAGRGGSDTIEVAVDGSDEDEEDGYIEDEGESPNSSSPLRPTPKPRLANKRRGIHESDEDLLYSTLESVANLDSDDSGFSSVQRGATTLSMFKRAPGPKNRRTPSRRSLHQNVPSENESPLDLIDENQEEVYRPELQPITNGTSQPDENHNGTKPSINFLNIHHTGNGEDRHSPDRSPTSQHKPYVPPLDLSILHEHGDGSDPIPAEQGPSLAIHKAKTLKEEDSVMLSPRMSKLKKKTNRHNIEAPLSPSAYRTIPYKSSPQDVPPSPPTEQSAFCQSGSRVDEDQSVQTKQLTKKIQSCKRKIKVFEESFEEEHGYRPSQADKASRPEVKKTMQELAKARKELRRLKEEIENYEHFGDMTVSMDNTIHRNVVRDAFTVEEPPPRMEDTLEVLQRRLAEKRREASRPEDLALESRDQMTEEKLAVQKALLQYENLHGRPTTKNEKDLMKPLYDRYRSIKRLLAKPVSPRERTKTLDPVPEDQAIEFAASPDSNGKSGNQEAVRIPTATLEEVTENEMVEVDKDFLVTRDFRLLKETLQPTSQNIAAKDLSPEGSLAWTTESPLHELTIKQLLEEQQKARVEKKRLRKVLREFEDDFLKQTGRKVQKDDRAPMETEYYEYKQVKARLKLLEALLSKHDRTSSY